MELSPGTPELVVIIPAYNEEELLGETIGDWLVMIALLGVAAEVWVIDDGSTDGTAAVLLEASRGHPALRTFTLPHAGHSHAVHTGYRIATNGPAAIPWIAQADADREVPVDAFVSLWERRAGADVVLGRRVGSRTPLRRVMSSAAGVLVRLLWWETSRPGLDPNVPFRLFRGTWLGAALGCLPDRPASPNLLLVGLACHTRASVVEVPVPFVRRSPGRTSIGCLLALCARTPFHLLAIRGRSRPPDRRRADDDRGE